LADIDDRMVGVLGADGVTTLERNHTCDGVILSGFNPVSMLRELLTSCDGFLVARGGKYHVMPGAPGAPDGTLTQAMLAGGFELHTETPDADLINSVKTEMVAPDRDYKPAVGPVLVRADLVRLDGQPLETTLSLPYTEGGNGAARPQRLALRKLKESRGTASGRSRRRAFTGTFGADAKLYPAGAKPRLAFEDFPAVDGVYLVTRRSRAAEPGTFTLEMVEWDNARFAFNPATDQRPFTLDAAVLAAQAA
jgi:hypothetical protein